MDVEGLSPVCEHPLLRDETVVASSSAPLVGQIHRALVGPFGFIVMIQHRRVGGGSKAETRREERADKHEKT